MSDLREEIGVEKDGGLIVVRMTESFYKRVHLDLTEDTSPYGTPIYTLWSALDDLRWGHVPTPNAFPTRL